MATVTTLANQLGEALKERGYMLVLAESCTGGMASEAVTSVAGSSAWFDRAYITYSNQAKIDLLGVSNLTLENYGAVSEQVAIEMAQGCLVAHRIAALKNNLALISASITGIAGPDGGTLDKPVGTVCFAWAGTNMAPISATEHFNGNRETIRLQATQAVMAGLIKALNLL